jgi:hypothetical protein
MEAAHKEKKTTTILDGCKRLVEERVSEGRDNFSSYIYFVHTLNCKKYIFSCFRNKLL